MVSLKDNPSRSWRHRLARRSQFALLPLLALGSLATAPAPAGANVPITDQQLPGATVGQPYSAQIAYSDSSGGPYTFTVDNNDGVPEGLSVDSSGAVSGTPQQQADAPDTFNFYVSVSDADSPGVTVAIMEVYITVTPPDYTPPPPLELSPSSIPEANINTPYSVTLQASGGTPPYMWSISSGSLPQGFTFSDGTISGQSEFPEQSTFTVTVEDSGNESISESQMINAGQSVSQTYTLTVTSGVATLDPTLGQVGGEVSSVQQQLSTDEATIQSLAAFVDREVLCVPSTLRTLLGQGPPSC
jgi:lipoprotein-anchoring transpeptidase ErfK/SrfK